METQALTHLEIRDLDGFWHIVKLEDIELGKGKCRTDYGYSYEIYTKTHPVPIEVKFDVYDKLVKLLKEQFNIKTVE